MPGVHYLRQNMVVIPNHLVRRQQIITRGMTVRHKHHVKTVAQRGPGACINTVFSLQARQDHRFDTQCTQLVGKRRAVKRVTGLFVDAQVARLLIQPRVQLPAWFPFRHWGKRRVAVLDKNYGHTRSTGPRYEAVYPFQHTLLVVGAAHQRSLHVDDNEGGIRHFLSPCLSARQHTAFAWHPMTTARRQRKVQAPMTAPPTCGNVPGDPIRKSTPMADTHTANTADGMTESKADIGEIRKSVRQLCDRYGENYWLKLDGERGYPTEFVRELTEAGFLTVLIPEEYGGAGLGVFEASVVMETVCRAGAHAGACHAQMYVMGSVLRHGTDAQKQMYLPKIAAGELRLQSFGVTEPTTGTDTTNLKTMARRDGDNYVVNGQKVWISRIEHSDLMVLLARTTPRDQVSKKTDGLSAFIVDVQQAEGNGLEIRPIDSMINHHSCELFFDNLHIPAENLLGEEGKGFKVILDGMNAERILIAAECVGDGRYFIDKASAYATEREVFGRPIGQNQGVQFPIARCYAEVEAAWLMVEKAARMFDAGQPCGAEANMAKMLASEASWRAGDVCMQTHGGFAFAREYHIERKFRETRLYQIAPISTNLILSYIGEHVLNMPRSF